MLIPVLRGLRWDLVSCLGVLLCSSLGLTHSSERETREAAVVPSLRTQFQSVCPSLRCL